MISEKNINIVVDKPYDYKPIAQSEKLRVTEIITKELLELAARFDGPCKVRIFLTAKGNA